MYFPYFIVYMLAGIIISLIVFFWAVRNGQFSDQQRIRYLPLEDGAQTAGTGAGRMHRLEAVVLLGLFMAGLAAMSAVLFFTLFRW
ncbi:MAG: cbb3-type cytochrome oxidase assembly protein [Desulfobacterales bacterium]